MLDGALMPNKLGRGDDDDDDGILQPSQPDLAEEKLETLDFGCIWRKKLDRRDYTIQLI